MGGWGQRLYGQFRGEGAAQAVHAMLDHWQCDGQHSRPVMWTEAIGVVSPAHLIFWSPVPCLTSSLSSLWPLLHFSYLYFIRKHYGFWILDFMGKEGTCQTACTNAISRREWPHCCGACGSTLLPHSIATQIPWASHTEGVL